MGRVLDDPQPMPARKGADGVEIAGPTAEMHRHYRFAARRHLALGVGEINGQRHRIDIDQDRFGAEMMEGCGRSGEGQGRRQEFVAGAKAAGLPRQMQPGGG